MPRVPTQWSQPGGGETPLKAPTVGRWTEEQRSSFLRPFLPACRSVPAISLRLLSETNSNFTDTNVYILVRHLQRPDLSGEWVEEGGAVIVKERMRRDLKRLRHIEFP